MLKKDTWIKKDSSMRSNLVPLFSEKTKRSNNICSETIRDYSFRQKYTDKDMSTEKCKICSTRSYIDNNNDLSVNATMLKRLRPVSGSSVYLQGSHGCYKERRSTVMDYLYLYKKVK